MQPLNDLITRSIAGPGNQAKKLFNVPLENTDVTVVGASCNTKVFIWHSI